MNYATKDWRNLAGRLAAEFAIVVLGVTIALWADSWVGDRNDREKELARLEALELNLEATAAYLDTSIENATGARDALRKLATPDRLELPASEWPGLLQYGLLYGSDFSPELNVYDDLKSSGELALLTAPAVRLALARMDAQINVTNIMETDLASVQVTNIDRYLVDNLDMRTVYGDALGLDLGAESSFGDYDFAGDRGLRNRVLLKLDIVMVLLEEYQNLRARIREVQDAITEQLESAR